MSLRAVFENSYIALSHSQHSVLLSLLAVCYWRCKFSTSCSACLLPHFPYNDRPYPSGTICPINPSFYKLPWLWCFITATEEQLMHLTRDTHTGPQDSPFTDYNIIIRARVLATFVSLWPKYLTEATWEREELTLAHSFSQAWQNWWSSWWKALPDTTDQKEKVKPQPGS